MLPSALESFATITGELEEKRLALFLDYDGTLTPIVSRPEQAVMTEAMRETLSNLAGLCPVAVVSGRDREDVENLVRLSSVTYAGSHGFDIAGPTGGRIGQTKGESFLPLLRQAETQVRSGLEGVEGARVESKKYAFAVHYRLVSGADKPRLENVVAEAAAQFPDLRKMGGKMVYDFLPRLDWDKGKAVEWLLEALDLDHGGVLPIYLGDDVTDEDAFRALRDKGIGILVAGNPADTAAHYFLSGVEEVKVFLDRLAGLLAPRSA